MVSEDRAKLLADLTAYQSNFEAELTFRDRFVALIEEHENCFERSLLKGHITGSAWIVNETFDQAFMTHHAKLNKWLQPGGHADGDENVARVALKEAHEETGMSDIKLYSQEIFDLDIHSIPERKGIPQHEHFDIRYLIIADKSQPYQVSEESNDLAWLSLDSLPELIDHNESIVRMIEKTKIIRGKMSSRTY